MALNPIPNQESRTLFSERCWLQGTVITAIVYGITLPLYFLSFYHLVHHEKKNHVRFRNRLLLLIFITVSGILGTLYMISLAGYIQMAFIDDRNYPGGPNAFEIDMFFLPINYVAATAYFVSSWLSDAVVVWRFKVIYQTCGVPTWIIMPLPCLLLAGSVAMGIMFLVGLETRTLHAIILAEIGLPFLALSLTLNVILTLAIVLRLLTFRHRIVSIMGPKYGTQYLSAAAMIVESAALYSVVIITYVALFESNNTVYQVFLQSLNQFQMVATLLIVFRVAQGKGWSQNTAVSMLESGLDLESMQFASPGASVAMASFMEGGSSSDDTTGDSSRQRPLEVDLDNTPPVLYHRKLSA